MRRNAHYPRPEVLALRRGNSIVLVMGILVLLVIIATAFITRTQAGRVTANASVRGGLRDDNARAMAEMLAQEISMALFPRPVDQTITLPGDLANSNTARLSPLRTPVRYGVDQDADSDGLPEHPYNFAPYHVVPYTNWPDGNQDPFWPTGPGNPGPVVLPPNSPLIFEGNPVGNPGFGDTRWLADHEPLRWMLPGPDGIPGTFDDLEAFSHWRHMANIAHPNNGFRIARDISDITNVNGFGGIVEDLSIPVEQWLAIRPFNLNLGTGDSFYPGNTYIDQWSNWFSFNYSAMYTNNSGFGLLNMPANFYNLSDLNANGIALEQGERPQDEFIGPSPAWLDGTPRWNVNRVLVDTDGDGFTDSFWYLAPTMTERGIRQIVAVRIIDNSAMLNVNVATRFNRLNTTGATPADLALVGELGNAPPPNNYNVGIFDNPAHHEGAFSGLYDETDIGYNRLMWADWTTGTPPRSLNYLTELSIQDENVPPIPNPNFPNLLATTAERLLYWQLAGRRPLDPVGGLTPFGLTEELELRMHYGQNYPWIVSRFEKAVQAEVVSSSGVQFLHANRNRQESNEYLDQLSNAELAFDHRRNLTMYSGARNDLLPPWLWWRWDIPQAVQDDAVAFPNEPVIDRFLAQARTKVDLRQPELGLGPMLPPGVRNFRQRLAPTLLLALIDGDGTRGTSYFGEYSTVDQTKLGRTRLAAAGLAANIREWRDNDSDLDLDDAEPLPKLNVVGPVVDVRMLGMERQPFLVEAFIGHVYKSHLVEPGYLNTGSHIVHEDLDNETIVVVQIGNPFDTIIQLSGFRLRVFDDGTGIRELDLGGLAINTIDPGKARTFYAIVDDLDGDAFHDPWVSELNVGAGANFANAENVTLSSTISTDRIDYDTGNEDRAIELLRLIPAIGGGNAAVVLDRIDILSENDVGFGDAVNGLAGPEPPIFVPPPPPADPPMDFYPGTDIGTDTHWIEWVHVTRAWHDDFAVANNLIDAKERNPRYVFAEREIDNGEDSYELVGSVITNFVGESAFNEFDKQCDACDERHFSMQMLQKDADFEQVGELLNVWVFGHELEFAGDIYQETDQTFSEFMIDTDLVGVKERVNRLRLAPTLSTEAGFGPVGGPAPDIGLVVGTTVDPSDPNYLLDPLHAVPALPAGARVLDAFVCDDRGVNGMAGVDELLNANGFTGKITPGLINVNTATPEVMRSAPHMARLVHEDAPPADNPFVRVPDAIVRYRERFGDPDPVAPSTDFTPDYGDRGDDTFIGDLRGERGIVSIGEIALLTRPADGAPPLEPDPNLYMTSFRTDFAGLGPFTDPVTAEVFSTRISTDVNDLPGNNPDLVAKDAEELNLLFAGMSNMLSTRSDVFTVYFRVRSFIQNPTTRVWDATNPEFIVDDSRYVMLVDRSEVNHPNDKPKILYLEKLPK